jgi:hypothetical protein
MKTRPPSRKTAENPETPETPIVAADTRAVTPAPHAPFDTDTHTQRSMANADHTRGLVRAFLSAPHRESRA